MPVQPLLDGAGLSELVFVGGEPPPGDAPFPTTMTHLGWRGRSARPVELARRDADLTVRLLTNGANADSSRLGVALIAAAMRAAGAPVTDEEEATFDDADAFLAKYDDAWCISHANFGLQGIASIAKTLPEAAKGAFIMPTNVGALTLAP